MFAFTLIVLSLQKPIFNEKGYCAKYCPSGPRKYITYYCCDSDHYSPLNLKDAIINNNYNWVNYYLEKYGNINDPIDYYYRTVEKDQSLYLTPLHLAVKLNRYKIASLLLSKGANVNIELDNGYTPLHLASIYGNPLIAELLIQNAVNINAVDNFNRTALHLAVLNKNDNMLEILLKNGIDIEKEMDYYMFSTALEISEFYKNHKSRIILENYDPLTQLLKKYNYEIEYYKPILKALGVKKISDINKLKGINKKNLFQNIEWSLSYSWLPTSFLCAPNCDQYKINLIRLINNN